MGSDTVNNGGIGTGQVAESLGLFPYSPKPIFPEYLLPALVCYRGADEDSVCSAGSVGGDVADCCHCHVVAVAAASAAI